ncbi:YidB family protein [Gymnodinialimonas sp. 2305UL16-5]|uniref:YidB family protein n=1 Tax=Gymnodinialimonas mytili TaxID=3126503 RepID=UPI00309F9197
MARRGPSLMALLGLVAVAGYQNRDKISQMLSDARHNADTRQSGGTGQSGLSSILSDVSRQFTGTGAGGALSSGLRELVDSFRGVGRADTADSWVAAGDNASVAERDLARAIGDEDLDRLSHQTGLSRQELLSRLSADLPQMVDRFTPEGRVPNGEEGQRFV